MRTNPNTHANSTSLPEINPSDLEAVRDFLNTDRPSSPSHRPHRPESSTPHPHVPLSIGITRAARNRPQPK